MEVSLSLKALLSVSRQQAYSTLWAYLPKSDTVLLRRTRSDLFWGFGEIFGSNYSAIHVVRRCHVPAPSCLCTQALRLNMEQGVTLVKDHIASLEFRGDTKASLLIGVCVGLVVVSIIAAYPGKPIDYSGVGEK